MKRTIIAFITALVCVLNCLNPITALAKENVGQSEFGAPNYDLYSNFMNSQYKTIASGNRMYLSALESCSNLEWFIERASVIIGEELSEERCIEILANMAYAMNYQLEDIIVNQASFDTTKQIKDYAVDVAGILAGTVGADEALKEAIGPTVETISTMMGIDSGLINLTCDSIEDFELLNQLLGDYKMQYNFLNCVAKYSSLEEMRQAAEILLNVDKEIFLNKLKTFNSSTENVAVFLGNDVFFDQIATKLLSDPSNFEDAATAEAAGYLSSLVELFGKSELSFDLTMFAGDMLFGTSNTYNRYNEMKALQDIRCAILKDISHNEPPVAATDCDTMWHNINMLKMVQYVDARGEYCCYQFVVYEGQLLSVIQMGNRETIQHNYEASIDICRIMLENIDQIITVDVSAATKNNEDAIWAGAVEAYKEACYFWDRWCFNQSVTGGLSASTGEYIDTYELGMIESRYYGTHYGQHCRAYDDNIQTAAQLKEAFDSRFTQKWAEQFYEHCDPLEKDGKLYIYQNGAFGPGWSGVDSIDKVEKIDDSTYAFTVSGESYGGGRISGKVGFEYKNGQYYFYPIVVDGFGDTNAFYYTGSVELKLPENPVEDSGKETTSEEEARKIYSEYFQNVDLTTLYVTYFDEKFRVFDFDTNSKEDYVIQSLLADLGNDGSYELLLKVSIPKLMVPTGYPEFDLLFTIIDGKVIQAVDTYLSGGTMGGMYLAAVYDTETNKHVLQKYSRGRDGWQYGVSTITVYDVADGEFYESAIFTSDAYSLDSQYYSADMDKIRTENPFAVEVDGYLKSYKLNDNYIAEDEYNKQRTRYVTPTDEKFLLKDVSIESLLP